MSAERQAKRLEDLEFMNEADLPSDLEDDDGDAEEDKTDVDGAEELQEQIETLRVQVKQYPNDYDSHKQFVDALRKAGSGSAAELRHAREKFSENFPLPEAVWLAWIEDEQEAVTANALATKDAKLKVVKLYERALADYLTPTLWVRYLSFVTDDLKSNKNLVMNEKETRDLFERSLEQLGAHMAEGSLLWMMYIMFEAVYAKDKYTAIQQLYRRELAIPHLSFDETLAGYAQNEMDNDPAGKDAQLASLKATIESSKKGTDKRRPFEDALANDTDYDKPRPDVSSYLEYIAFETKQKPLDVARVRLLYERAVTSHPLQAQLWAKFTGFLDQHVKVAALVLPTHVRATRNCGWSGDIWANYLRALERLNSSKKDVEDAYHVGRNYAFQSGDELAKLHLAYIEYLRHQAEATSEARKLSHQVLRPAIENALFHVSQKFGGDPYVQIERVSIRLEAFHWGDMVKAREQYEDLLAKYSRFGDLWLEFASMERALGDINTARSLYKRAIGAHCDDVRIFTEALSFEREEGDLASYDSVFALVQSQMTAMENQQKQAEKAEQAALEAEAKKAGDKRKRGDKDTKDSKGKDAVAAKDEETPKNKKQKKAHDPAAASAPPSKTTDGVTEAPSSEEQKPRNPYKDTNLQDYLVFVSNLNYFVTEDKLRSIFQSSGEIVEVKIERDPSNNNASKGYGHIEFKTKEAVQHALARDHELVEKRPVFVTKFVSARPGARREMYPTSAALNTVFVRNLPSTINEKKLTEAFVEKGHTEIKQVRLATHKSGHAKHFAYIEFNDEMAARRALTMDNVQLDDTVIQVQMSNPPKKDTSGDAAGGAGGSSADDSVTFGSRKPAPKVLVPRQLLKKPAADSAASPSDSSSAGASAVPLVKRSQDDFRKMFLNK